MKQTGLVFFLLLVIKGMLALDTSLLCSSLQKGQSVQALKSEGSVLPGDLFSLDEDEDEEDGDDHQIFNEPFGLICWCSNSVQLASFWFQSAPYTYRKQVPLYLLFQQRKTFC